MHLRRMYCASLMNRPLLRHPHSTTTCCNSNTNSRSSRSSRRSRPSTSCHAICIRHIYCASLRGSLTLAAPFGTSNPVAAAAAVTAAVGYCRGGDAAVVQLNSKQIDPYAAAAQHISSSGKYQHANRPAVATAVAVAEAQAAAATVEAEAATINLSSTAATAAAAVTQRPAVALDVEYSHLVLHGGQKVAAPAWVAVVDENCELLLKTYIKPKFSDVRRSYGGVPFDHCSAAPTLKEVQQQLQLLLKDKTLIGHGLAKDLAALGLSHPQNLRYDTITYPGFCNRAGNARNLKQLAETFLGLGIQQGQWQQQQQQQQQQGQWQQQQQQQQQQQEAGSRGEYGVGQQQQQQQQGHWRQQQQRQRQRRRRRAQHDPEEDAVAVMKLYQQVVLPSTYEGQVAAATHQLMLDIQQRRQRLAFDDSEDED